MQEYVSTANATILELSAKLDAKTETEAITLA
jgi:hypothetical protein